MVDNIMVKEISYVVVSGTETPERLYTPFVLATTAKNMDIDATIYFGVKGVTVMKKAATLNDLALEADAILNF